MRLFLAINLDPALRATVYEAASPLRAAAPSLRWVREEQLHFTIKFIGEQEESAVAPLAEALRRAAARHRTLSLVVGRPGGFPNLRRPRVLWMGVEREPRLELLHHDVEIACETLGYEVEGRPFRPHLTLARARAPLAVEETRALVHAAKGVRFREELVVHSIDLMNSERTPAGSRYALLAAAPLRSD